MLIAIRNVASTCSTFCGSLTDQKYNTIVHTYKYGVRRTPSPGGGRVAPAGARAAPPGCASVRCGSRNRGIGAVARPAPCPENAARKAGENIDPEGRAEFLRNEYYDVKVFMVTSIKIHTPRESAFYSVQCERALGWQVERGIRGHAVEQRVADCARGPATRCGSVAICQGAHPVTTQLTCYQFVSSRCRSKTIGGAGPTVRA